MRHLCIVARSEPRLDEYLTRYFAGRSDVEVIRDRREGRERRQRDGAPPTERREVDRRLRRVEFVAHSFAVVRVS
jgi:hypothetical protein